MHYSLASLVSQEVLEFHQNVGHNIPRAHPFLLSDLDLHALPSAHSNGIMKMCFCNHMSKLNKSTQKGQISRKWMDG